MNPRLLIAGEDRPGEVRLSPAHEFVIGRDERADMSIDDAWLSRRHCVVTCEDGKYFIEDCKSANGTFLNGEKVRKRQALRHGDRIGIGDTEILFLTEAEDAPAEPPVYLDETPAALAPAAAAPQSNTLPATLLRFIDALRETRKPEAIRERLLDFVFDISPADRAAVLLMDRDGQQFETLTGRDRRNRAKSVRVSRTIVERVYKDGAAIVSNDLEAAGLDDVESLKAARVRALVCAPLEAFDRRIGVIYADAADPDAEFDGPLVELLSGVAVIAAIALEHAARIERLEFENALLRRDLGIHHDLIGQSAAMLDVARAIARAAPSNASVLILGESGTGKELAARAIHRNSPRSGGPFVAINCASLPEHLAESELFGHEKGAFTGAVSQKKGRFELAGGGTVFLDEIGDLPPPIQAKLLRAIQEREIERVGGTRPVKVDIRIVSATNRDLEAAVASNAFRADLLYRLNAVTIRIPPLRERREDIPLLARHFAARHCRENGKLARGISPKTERILTHYAWPGNVRQLQNAIERAVLQSEEELLLPEDLPEELFEAASFPPEMAVPNFFAALDRLRRELVEKAYAQTGDAREAAKILGLHPHYFYGLVNRMGMGRLRKSIQNNVG